MSAPSTTRRHSSGVAAEFDPAHSEAALLARVEELATKARALGADEAEAFGSRTETIAVRFEKGELKLAQVDEGSSIGLRVFKDKRQGFTSTNQISADTLATAARDALALARFAPPDAHNALPAARPIPRTPTLVEPALARLTVDEVVEQACNFVARVKAIDPRLSIDSASAELVRTTLAVHSSSGVHVAESDAMLGFSVFGMAIDGEDVGGFHYDGDSLRRYAEIKPAMERVAQAFGEITLENLASQAAESYRGPVLFSPDAFQDVFLAPLVAASSAIAVQRGRSPLKGKLGLGVATNSLTLHDDPSDRSLAGAGSFDREGQPAERRALVERGVLQTFLYNGYAAAVEGRSSTGHARGGARGVPGLGPHAIVVAPGSGGSRAQMLTALGRGLFVQRFSGTVDPASGDFSGVAKSSRWVEGGRIVRPLKETLISGNCFALLQQILALSTETERLGGAATGPFALVDQVNVTAG